MPFTDIAVQTPEQIPVAQTRIALKTDELLHQLSSPLQLTFQFLNHCIHAYKPADGLQELQRVLQVRITLTRDQCAIECLGITRIAIPDRPAGPFVDLHAIQSGEKANVLVYGNPGNGHLPTAFLRNGLFADGNHIFNRAPLFGAKEVVNGTIPQCCILVCRHSCICKQ